MCLRQIPATVHANPARTTCLLAESKTLNLDANKTLHISTDKCEAPHSWDPNKLIKFVQFTFYDGTLRVVGRVDPSKSKRMNIIEIVAPTSGSRPPLNPEIYGLYQKAMRQFLVKQLITEIYYNGIGGYRELPPPK